MSLVAFSGKCAEMYIVLVIRGGNFNFDPCLGYVFFYKWERGTSETKRPLRDDGDGDLESRRPLRDDDITFQVIVINFCGVVCQCLLLGDLILGGRSLAHC